MAHHRTIRGLIAWFASTCALLGVLSTVAPARAAGPSKSPRNEILVVTANVREAWEPRDVREAWDMKNFVSRIVPLLPYKPDVLLLQEVTARSAATIAKLLGRATGNRFAVVVKPWAVAQRRDGRMLYKRDTAIVINLATMQETKQGGYLTHRYARSDAVRGKPVQVVQTAYTVVHERKGRFDLPVSSSHFVTRRGTLRTETLDRRYRLRWSRDIAARLRRFGSRRKLLRVAGGDFNAERCWVEDEAGTCTKFLPWWKFMTETSSYSDALRERINVGGIDYVFGRGNIIRAGLDRTWTQAQRLAHDAPDFYSDHRFRWALVGDDHYKPKRPTNLIAKDFGKDATLRVRVNWAASSDPGGSELAGYKVYKSKNGTTFRLVATTTEDLFEDTRVRIAQRYWYRVVAYDNAGNHSRAADIQFVTGTPAG